MRATLLFCVLLTLTYGQDVNDQAAKTSVYKWNADVVLLACDFLDNNDFIFSEDEKELSVKQDLTKEHNITMNYIITAGEELANIEGVSICGQDEENTQDGTLLKMLGASLGIKDNGCPIPAQNTTLKHVMKAKLVYTSTDPPRDEDDHQIEIRVMKDGEMLGSAQYLVRDADRQRGGPLRQSSQ